MLKYVNHRSAKALSTSSEATANNIEFVREKRATLGLRVPPTYSLKLSTK
jgi:hypothetical protein